MAVGELLHEGQGLGGVPQQVCAAAAQLDVPPLQRVQLLLQLQSLVSRYMLHQFQP